MLGKFINSTSKYNILAPVYVCEDNNPLLFIEIHIIRILKIAYTSPIIIRSLHCKNCLVIQPISWLPPLHFKYPITAELMC